MKHFVQTVAVCLSLILSLGAMDTASAQSRYLHNPVKQTAALNKKVYLTVILPDIIKKVQADVSTAKQKIERTLIHNELFTCKKVEKTTVYAVYIELTVAITDISGDKNSLVKQKTTLGQHLLFTIKDEKVVSVYPFEPFMIDSMQVRSM